MGGFKRSRFSGAITNPGSATEIVLSAAKLLMSGQFDLAKSKVNDISDVDLFLQAFLGVMEDHFGLPGLDFE
jgi:hypothetical protein